MFSYFRVSLPAIALLAYQCRPSLAASFAANMSSNAANSHKYKYVILGGGNAAGYAAEEFVKNGAKSGEVALVGKESVAPYERPALSKAALHGNPPARLPGFHTTVAGSGSKHEPSWYKENGVDLFLNEEVVNADLDNKKLESKSGLTVEYEKLVIATGSSAVQLGKLPNADAKGIHYLREYDDAMELYDALKRNTGKEVIVIGGGYIGMEVGAAASMLGCKVKMVFPEDFFMPRLFSSGISEFYEKAYKEKGVQLYNKGYMLDSFLKDDTGASTGIVMKKGDGSKEELGGAIVVVGVGAKPNTSLFEKQLEMENGGIKVDGSFKTSKSDVYAVGDLVTFPLKMYGDRPTRMEHVAHARQSAKHGVQAVLGKTDETYDYLPYFYSRVFDLGWQFYGDNDGEVVIVGDMKPTMSAFWVKDGKVVGVFSESPSKENAAAMPEIARKQPAVDVQKLRNAASVDEAFQLVSKG